MGILGKKITAAREAAGLSMGDLARASGISKAHISKLECGEQDNPGIHLLIRLTEALSRHISLHTLAYAALDDYWDATQGDTE